MIDQLILFGFVFNYSVQIAVTWIKILVQTHASQLMAIGTLELFSMFGPLLGIVEYRANTLQQLTKYVSSLIDLLFVLNAQITFSAI